MVLSGFEVTVVELSGHNVVWLRCLGKYTDTAFTSWTYLPRLSVQSQLISMPERGVVLLQRAEALYAQGKSEETFELYQRAIKKILKDEDVAALLPAIVPNDTPKETLGFLWRNFAGFFKDPAMKFATGMPTFVTRVLT